MKPKLTQAHRIAYLSSVFLIFVIYYPLLWLYCKNPQKNYSKITQIRRKISVYGACMAGIRFEVQSDTIIDWNKAYVLCPNHSSILDITALTYLQKKPFSFIGKVELLKNPITKLFFKTVDIPVDRGSKISSFKAFKRANELLQEGRSVVVFPEGKIDDEFPPRLHEFKAGAFRMAIDNQISIIPIIIENAWIHFWDDGKRFGSGPARIKIRLLAPIETANLQTKDSPELEKQVYTVMSNYWEKINSIII